MIALLQTDSASFTPPQYRVPGASEDDLQLAPECREFPRPGVLSVSEATTRTKRTLIAGKSRPIPESNHFVIERRNLMK